MFSTFVYMVPISAVLFFGGDPHRIYFRRIPADLQPYFAQIIVFGQLGLLGIGSAFLAETYIIAGS